MSEHSLPPDPSSWPSDPFRLLGVAPGVSARDLRKAYLKLIRSYKPEHSPREFQRIREAYESLEPFVGRLDSTGDRPPVDDEPKPPMPPASETPRDISAPVAGRLEVAPDPWDLACRGEPETAYRALIEQEGRGLAREDAYLQLYWLLAILPGLDAARSPVDWLIRGLGACEPEAGRLRELLRRGMAADPSLALDDRLAGFVRRRTPPPLALDVVEARWRAARASRRWSLVLADVNSLRAWLPGADEAAWARALLAASANLAWAERPDSDHASAFAREVEGLGHRSRDHSDELYQLEYVQVVKSGLDRLGGHSGAFGGIYQLLAASWDEQGPEFRARFRSYVAQIARDPAASLECLDQIHAQAPAVLGRLSTLLGLDLEGFRAPGPAAYAEIAPWLDRFLASSRWDDYPAFRPQLLQFCLREAVSPGLVARTMAERPEFILTGKGPLSHAIDEDWPLRHAYRASEIDRQDSVPG